MTDCNTKSRSRYWFLTWNNYTNDWLTKLTTGLGAESWVLQPEKCPTTGTPHIQGILQFKSQKAFETLHKEIKQVRWERVRSKEAAIRYCSKLETKDGKTEIHGFQLPKKLIDPMEGKTLQEWQEKIINIIKEKPDDRKIHWFWETQGGIGKTSLAKSICIKNKSAIYICGNASDIKYAICSMGEGPEIVIWDIPRSIKNNIDYSALEQVKNGIFFSTKYESGQMIFNIPHIIVFANDPPKNGELSSDRWDIHNITHISGGIPP